MNGLEVYTWKRYRITRKRPGAKHWSVNSHTKKDKSAKEKKKQIEAEKVSAEFCNK